MIPSQFPSDWYWLADDGRLYASGRQEVVSAGDASYTAWLVTGLTATRWPRDEAGEQTDAALQEVLDRYGLHVSLTSLKAALRNSIDTAAEAERRKYITPGSGQAMTYQAKAEEARRYAANPADPAGFPLLSAEVGITAPTLAEVAAVVSAAYSSWLAIGAAIEAARLAAKAAISDAPDQASALAAAAAVTWPS